MKKTYIVTHFYLIPEGSKTTRKRNKFLADKHGAMVLSGEMAKAISDLVQPQEGTVDSLAQLKQTVSGLVKVSDVPLLGLLELRDLCAGNNPTAYRALHAIINMNFLEEDLTNVSATSTQEH
ncbi:hypothetical protein NVP1215B_055 [Vibrio phage 1.215.B._10N.222.54.F7]|nr:hypothetical protein NVP1215A_055 [Vibrio phage 1.215.A._10N.222.54.F7]AUR96078.1 hypothetical protein NVP1215B_055 [Vibrio phage 1.215.B._10N.222.54.F7]